MAASDQDLVAAALRGSEDAYRAIVERYERPLLSLVLRIARDRAWAEDLTQDSFLKAFNALESFHLDRKFSSWLFKIAHNTALDALRRRRVATVPIETTDSEAPDLLDSLAGSDLDSPERTLEGKGLAGAIAAAIAGLRPDYRSAIELRFIQGLPYDEIAEIMGLPLGTVKTHLHRARKGLVKALRAEGWRPEG